MRLSYNFNDEEKQLMILLAEDEAIEEMLKLSGKSVFWSEEAIYLSERVEPFNLPLAAKIRQHPGLQETAP